MLLLGINGSPHKEGNTAFLIRTALKEAQAVGAKTREIYVAEIMKEEKKPYCDHCSAPCSGSCFSGSALEEAFTLMSTADALILGSPVYFGTVSAQLKAFWDKTRKLRADKSLINTVGAAVTVGAGRFGGQETTAKALMDMMLIQGMTLVGDGFRADDSGHQGGFAQSPAQEDINAIKRVKILANRLVEVGEATQDLRKIRRI